MIDLRSDTVTRPTPAMRQAVAEAEVGDDVYGDDPTVNELERRAAELLDKEAALYVTSGTQANLCAVLAHCDRGEEYLVGQHAHTYRYEAGGAAVLGSVQPQPVELQADGTFDLELLASHVKPQPSMYHFAISKLLCLENTHDGKILPPGYVAEAQQLARDRGLGLHLDGARLWNAAVGGGQEPAEVAAGFDTVSVCLSKGLGAPVGSVLTGSATLVEEARRWRKMLGGGMRQAGVVAAAGLHAITHHIDRLADDHANAARLAEGLGALPRVTVDGPHTNMIFLSFDEPPDGAGTDHFQRPDVAVGLCEHLQQHGIIARPGAPMRLVTHLDVSKDDVEQVVDACAEFLAS